MDTPGGIVYLFQHIGASLQRQVDQSLLEQLGIGTSQFRILKVLQVHPEMSQRGLASNLGQTEASISRQIRILHVKGMIITQTHPRSKRERITALSSKGVAVIEAAQELFEQSAEPLLKCLSSRQQKGLLELLSGVHQQTCLPGNLSACNHQLDHWEQQPDNNSYIFAIT